MTVGKSLDIKNLKIVDSSEVPTGRIKVTKWQEVFSRIPPEKALVVKEGEVSFTAIRSALYELQKKGQLKQLRARKIREADGSHTMYIVNEEKDETAQKSSSRQVKK